MKIIPQTKIDLSYSRIENLTSSEMEQLKKLHIGKLYRNSVDGHLLQCIEISQTYAKFQEVRLPQYTTSGGYTIYVKLDYEGKLIPTNNNKLSGLIDNLQELKERANLRKSNIVTKIKIQVKI